MLDFIYKTLYPKFKDDEELWELVVDALISMAFSESNIKLLLDLLEGNEFNFSPEQKY